MWYIMRVKKKPEFFDDREKLLRHLLLEQQASESMHNKSANQFAFNYSRILPTLSRRARHVWKEMMF